MLTKAPEMTSHITDVFTMTLKLKSLSRFRVTSELIGLKNIQNSR